MKIRVKAPGKTGEIRVPITRQTKTFVWVLVKGENIKISKKTCYEPNVVTDSEKKISFRAVKEDIKALKFPPEEKKQAIRRVVEGRKYYFRKQLVREYYDNVLPALREILPEGSYPEVKAQLWDALKKQKFKEGAITKEQMFTWKKPKIGEYA